MAGREAIICDAIFFNRTTRRATHIGIPSVVIEALERVYAEPVHNEFDTLSYGIHEGEERSIAFTDVLVVSVLGPAYEPPKHSI